MRARSSSSSRRSCCWKRGRLRLHGAALEPGDAAPVGGDARDMAMLVDLYKMPIRSDETPARSSAGQRRFGPSRQTVMPAGELPHDAAQAVLRSARPRAVGRDQRQSASPFWIDTVGNLAARRDPRQARQRHPALLAPARQTYASNSHIFLMWMVGTSVVLLTVAILFLRNQIRPILRLAEAADDFGKGRPVPPDFRPRGAREVRQAAQAFLEMRDRIEHHVEQRTTMLAGVSHDLRTVLTRFKLELALLGSTPEVEACAATSTRCSTCSRTTWPSPRATAARRAAPTNVGELLDEVQRGRRCTTARPIEVRMRQPNAPSGAAAEAAGLQARGDQSRHQRRPLWRLCRRSAPARTRLAAHRGRRRRPGHSAGRARQRVPAVLPAGQRPQPGRGQHRPGPGDRPRHRPQPWRRHRARAIEAWGSPARF